MSFDGIKTAWVDFDGTLLDSSGCWKEAYRILCERQCAPISHATMRLFDEIPFEKWEELVMDQLGICDKDLLKVAKSTYLPRLPNKTVLSIIESLPRDCAVSIVTREPKELVDAWLSYHGIELFTEIVTAGIEREQADFYTGHGFMLIDDNYKNCKTAKAAGAFVIGVNCHHSSEQADIMRRLCDIYLETDYISYS